MRHEESKAIFDFREKLQRLKLKKSPILIQVSEFYIPPLFDLFHDEIDLASSCKVKKWNESEGRFSGVIIVHKKEHVEHVVNGIVEIDNFENPICLDVRCTCRKFESFEILCGHVLKGIDRMSVMEIPERYILGRWRLNAKDCVLGEDKSRVHEEDPKLVKAARLRILCPKLIKIATRSCELEEAYEFMEEQVKYMCAKVGKMLLGSGKEDSIEVETTKSPRERNIDPKLSQVKALKKKNALKVKGRRRQKPWHEKPYKRKKVVPKSTPFSEHIDHSTATTIAQGAFLMQPPDVEIPYVPQMMSCEDSCIPSSSQASHDPQTFKEMHFYPSSYNPFGAGSLVEDAWLTLGNGS